MKRLTKILIYFFLLFLTTNISAAQGTSGKQAKASFAERPKLVVGIVVDQMRYDYLPRFWDKFSENGFKRLIGDGFSFRNHHFNYFPTYTGPGHAAIYTGTTPSINGIVGNAWYDRSIDESMYVVSDSTVMPVGTDGSGGKMSPANLLSTTVTDELKSANRESKVIGISIKDRGAILPAGHVADGAFWYEDSTGNFISSSWYADQLPQWLKDFNRKGLAREFNKKTWNTLLPIERYTESNPDDSPYEGAFDGEERPVFPHDLAEIGDGAYWPVKSSPYGNTLVKEAAQAAIKGESLGSDSNTDFLAVSFSSTDYVGHQFGPHSVELEDTYLRLDRDLADFLSYLDETVGKGNYLVFLTADHGVVDVPAELKDRNLPGGYFDSDMVVDSLASYLEEEYGNEDWIESYTNQQVYLDRDLVSEQGYDLAQMQEEAAEFLLQFEGVKSTMTAHDFHYKDFSDGQQAMYERGFMYGRSGDVYIELKSGWLDSSYRTGTSHGSPYTYDTHVPLLFYGWNVPQGYTDQKTVIPQIAPTVARILNIPLPSGSPAKVLEFERE